MPSPDDTRELADRVLFAKYEYRVEIMHVEKGATDWVHIHTPDWETTEVYFDARQYAIAVWRDHPGSEVRLVETSPELPTAYLSPPSFM